MSNSILTLWRSGGHRLLTNCKSELSFSRIDVAAVSSLINSPLLIQTREMSRVKTRKVHPFFWWTKKRRERHDEELAGDNKDFVKQVIIDRLCPTIPETGMPHVSPLKNFTHQRGEWNPKSVRTGVIAKKVGVHPMWDKEGNRIMTTLLQIYDNHVVKYLTPEMCQRNYGNRFGNLGVLIVGAESGDPQRFTKEYCGLFNDCGTLPKVKLARFTVTPEAALLPGTPLYASHFQVGQLVDVYGITVRRGFEGVMIRWGFHGMPATHGVTKSHRRGGNIGGGGEKGRVWPGTKMPGHMGGDKRSANCLEILRINTKYNVIYVKGQAIPGDTNSFVTIRDTFVPKGFWKSCPPAFPTYYPDEEGEQLPDDIFAPRFHNFSDPTILFEEKR